MDQHRRGHGRAHTQGHACLRPRGRLGLTLVADEEAHAGAAAVGGEEQVQDVPGADKEPRGLRAVELADERGRRGRAVPHLQRVVVDFRLESADTRKQPALKRRAAGADTFPSHLLSLIKSPGQRRSEHAQ